MTWHTLDLAQWRAWRSEHELIEEDGFGPKVFRCNNGDYIKVFRIKHPVSMARFFNPALHFCGNAARLHTAGIATISPHSLYHIPHKPRWAVRYQPLPGDTVRDLLSNQRFSNTQITALGKFIAHLHQRGIYFRSLHPGNVVLQADSTFGLIDVLDCHFRWGNRPLNHWQRNRNLQHLLRYDDGKQIEVALRTAYEAAVRQ